LTKVINQHSGCRRWRWRWKWWWWAA